MNPDLATTTTAPPITSAATNLMVVLCAAEMRGLPMPFVAKAYETGEITLQFHARAEVHTWATALDVPEVIHDSHTHTDGINDTTTAAATWHDVPLTLVASVPRMPRSGVAS